MKMSCFAAVGIGIANLPRIANTRHSVNLGEICSAGRRGLASIYRGKNGLGEDRGRMIG